MAGSSQLVKELREKTGAGILDCQKALSENGNDVEKSIDYLRQKGLAAAAKKAGRETNQGLIHSYIHMGGKIGVLIEVNCETDFVARNEEFKSFVNDLALQVAAAKPSFVKREDVPADVAEKEKAIYRAQMENSGKPANVLEKIIEGKLGSFYSQFVLLDQPSIRDGSMTVAQVVAQATAKTGENIQINRFVRYRMGEGAEA